ncbi:MAG TPA: metal ABC transporter permease [Verrucomicrobiae bacterium]|nr:metal ABC transporter permease [Verrucomicrobiae bacterium]
MIEQIHYYLSYDFVRNALVAGSLAAVLGAAVGYFVVVRKVSFAAHSLAHIGFTGATGAALVALTPLEGMLIISVLAGMMMGATGNRLQRSDMAIGMTLSFCLGVGTLFLVLYKGFAGQATAILFGNIFGVSHYQIIQTLILSAVSLGTLLLFSRRLLFASVQPDLAEARGVSLSTLAMVFMVILAISVTLASQVVGILLVFTLIIGPAGVATRFCRNFWSGQITSVVIGLFAVWMGILLACFTSWPPSFWITAILFVFYLMTEAVCRFVLRME